MAVTYQSGPRKRDLRTVIVKDARTIVLATSGAQLLVGKLIHGTQCACRFWDEVLGTEGDDFAVPREQVVAQWPIQIGAKVVRHK